MSYHRLVIPQYQTLKKALTRWLLAATKLTSSLTLRLLKRPNYTCKLSPSHSTEALLWTLSQATITTLELLEHSRMRKGTVFPL